MRMKFLPDFHSLLLSTPFPSIEYLKHDGAMRYKIQKKFHTYAVEGTSIAKLFTKYLRTFHEYCFILILVGGFQLIHVRICTLWLATSIKLSMREKVSHVLLKAWRIKWEKRAMG